ncbi:hypothetical protein B6V01_003240 [Methanosarcinales archaeon ex4572_44]|nr:MAG: hypothetical protein B6V01_003240 [Methanosarcinales archaeon ex4572_44]RLG28114.1 MAG: hypothetical protein DRN70_01060 [Methanosarcinales archaeon]
MHQQSPTTITKAISNFTKLSLFAPPVSTHDKLTNQPYRCFYISYYVSCGCDHMIEITDSALKEVRQIQRNEKMEGHGLRIYTAGVGCSGLRYGLRLVDAKGEDDSVFDSKGLNIYVEGELGDRRGGFIIDYIDDQRVKGFTIGRIGLGCGSACSKV